MQNKEKEKLEPTILKDCIKILFLMYLVTFILLLFLALALFKMEISEMVSKIWLIAVYVISGFFGGFLIGKRRKSKKFLWGFLIGLLYFVILLAISLLLYKGLAGDWIHFAMTMVLCTVSATVGGMVS